MGRRIEIDRQRGWVEPAWRAARDAQPGDVIVVKSLAQRDFLRMELASIGKQGVKTVATARSNPYAYPFDVRDSNESATKLVNWLQVQAQAARQHI